MESISERWPYTYTCINTSLPQLKCWQKSISASPVIIIQNFIEQFASNFKMRTDQILFYACIHKGSHMDKSGYFYKYNFMFSVVFCLDWYFDHIMCVPISIFTSYHRDLNISNPHTHVFIKQTFGMISYIVTIT